MQLVHLALHFFFQCLSETFDFRVSKTHYLMRPLQFQGVTVETQLVAPAAQRLQQTPPPTRKANILDGRPARVDHQLEVIDVVFGPQRQPRKPGIGPYREVVPPVARPLFRAGWKLKPAVDLSVHGLSLRRRDVVLQDYFGAGVDLLDPANEGDALARVALGLLRIAHHKRE